jgi:hypothetical protein
MAQQRSMASFLTGLEARAKRDTAEHLALQRIGLPLTTGLIGAIVFAAFGAGEYYPLTAPGVMLAAVASGGAGAWLGAWASRRSAAALERHRTEVRRNLLDGGLLRLLLEPDPYDRLPSLQPVIPQLLGRHAAQPESEPLQARLRRFVGVYSDCCAEAGLLPGILAVGSGNETQRRPRQTGPQLRLQHLLGSAMFLGGVTAASAIPGPRWLALLLQIGLLVGGMLVMNYGGSARDLPAHDPFAQGALLSAAVRLELASALAGAVDEPLDGRCGTQPRVGLE